MRKLRKLVLLPLLSLLPACSTANTGIEGTAELVCKSWTPIRPSRKLDVLSEDTARQIAGNNAAQSAWCNSKPKA